ncbi:uncharacterized protein LOC143277827 [Babylonia areolata]|uniref:uncharacterized protein LOC143277827 n=1 Tax=Babylonia areolata TaxID=304850 RepID=UPI003FCF86FD
MNTASTPSDAMTTLAVGPLSDVSSGRTVEGSAVFPGMSKGEEVVVVAVLGMGVLAVLALVLRLALPLLRKGKASSAPPQHSATCSTSGSERSFSVKGKEFNNEALGRPDSPEYPTLSRLQSLNMQDVYNDNWKKTSTNLPPTLSSELTEVQTEY